ncbi:MAG: hypothetical protein HC789_12980 [Microcoleus sp. CSU_2_2]|nr:hypothetical protein [Microcoleus sp. SU_5_3]NJS11217.1 hypothetical protein [Microcoleus sp. CSU_2_2]
MVISQLTVVRLFPVASELYFDRISASVPDRTTYSIFQVGEERRVRRHE